MTGGECHKLATLSSGFLFFTSFFSYDSRFIQVTAVQRSPRSLVDGNVPTVLVRLEIRFPLSGVPVWNELDSSFGYTGRLMQKKVSMRC